MSIAVRVTSKFFFELKDINSYYGYLLLKNCKICHEIEVGNIARLILLSQATNAEVKCRLHAMTLVHVHKNILDNKNLSDVPSQFVDRKDRRK